MATKKKLQTEQKSKLNEESVQAALALYLQPDPDKPNKHLFTLEHIARTISKKFKTQTTKNTVNSWARRYDWKTQWETLQIQGTVQANKQIQEEKEQLKEDFNQSVIQTKAQSIYDIKIQMKTALNEVDETLKNKKLGPKDKAIAFEKLCKGIAFLNRAVIETEELEKRYSIVQPEQDKALIIQLDEEGFNRKGN